MHDFLGLTGKKLLIFGVANRKSVAYHIVQVCRAAGAECVCVVRDQATRESTAKILDGLDVLTCDVEQESEIAALPAKLIERFGASVKFDGVVHSIAFADYSEGMKPFYETPKHAFLQAVDISCFSFVEIANQMRPLLNPDAAFVTISISTTRMASESYGYMGPVKAALDATLAFLAKSFSGFSKIRFNAVGASPLKTSASAGIPGYIDAYLYAEKATLRGQAVTTAEVARVAAFLLSPASSAINAQKLIVDAGMETNYFDQEIIRKMNQ